MRLPTARVDTVNMDNTNGCPTWHVTRDFWRSTEYFLTFHLFTGSSDCICWCLAAGLNWTRCDNGHWCPGFHLFPRFHPGCRLFLVEEQLHTKTWTVFFFSIYQHSRFQPCLTENVFLPTHSLPFPSWASGLFSINSVEIAPSTEHPTFFLPGLLRLGVLQGKGLSSQPKGCRMLSSSNYWAPQIRLKLSIPQMTQAAVLWFKSSVLKKRKIIPVINIQKKSI